MNINPIGGLRGVADFAAKIYSTHSVQNTFTDVNENKWRELTDIYFYLLKRMILEEKKAVIRSMFSFEIFQTAEQQEEKKQTNAFRKRQPRYQSYLKLRFKQNVKFALRLRKLSSPTLELYDDCIRPFHIYNKELAAEMYTYIYKNSVTVRYYNNFAVQDMINIISGTLLYFILVGDSVSIKDFGTFFIEKKIERIRRNPAEGKKVTIPESFALKFKANSKFLEQIKSL